MDYSGDLFPINHFGVPQRVQNLTLLAIWFPHEEQKETSEDGSTNEFGAELYDGGVGGGICLDGAIKSLPQCLQVIASFFIISAQ